MYELHILHKGRENESTIVKNPDNELGLFKEYGEAILYAQKNLQIDTGDSIDVRVFKTKR